jgi:beta-xylosidase
MSTNSTINPIIPGFAPDPSLILVDGTYFLVNSTFHLFPGLPIYTSKDLAHWDLIGVFAGL